MKVLGWENWEPEVSIRWLTLRTVPCSVVCSSSRYSTLEGQHGERARRRGVLAASSCPKPTPTKITRARTRAGQGPALFWLCRRRGRTSTGGDCVKRRKKLNHVTIARLLLQDLMAEDEATGQKQHAISSRHPHRSEPLQGSGPSRGLPSLPNLVRPSRRPVQLKQWGPRCKAIWSLSGSGSRHAASRGTARRDSDPELCTPG